MSRSSYKGGGALRLASFALLVLFVLLLVCPSHIAQAAKAGVAAAVNPDAFTSLGNAPKTELRIGKSIFFNERINTTSSGLVQVLLIDGSTFTVGPGSDLVIDKFVYNPNTQTGEIAATFTKGALRFVGGKISKNPEGVTVNTPQGTLSIRGGMFMAKVWAGGAIFAFLYGDQLKLTTLSGKELVVFEPGNGIFINGGFVEIKQTTQADINALMAALSKAYNTAAADTTKIFVDWKLGRLFDLLSLEELIAEATETQIQGQLQKEEQEQANNSSPSNDTISPTPEPVPPGPGPLPPASGGVPRGFATGFYIRNEEETLVPTFLPEAAYDPEQKTISFIYGEPNDTASIAFDASGQATSDAMTVFQAGQQVPVVPGSTATLNTSPQLLCQSCTFLSFGKWDAHIAANILSPTPVKIDVDDGWWVAGEVTSVANLDTLGVRNASATYVGSVQGTVASLSEGAWQSFDTSGDLTMHWNFGSRVGDLTIGNFDGRSYGTGAGGLTQPSRNLNQFGGSLTQLSGPPIASLTGSATGSFVNDRTVAAGGVMGNWGVNSPAYRATGIFGGAGIPH